MGYFGCLYNELVICKDINDCLCVTVIMNHDYGTLMCKHKIIINTMLCFLRYHSRTNNENHKTCQNCNFHDIALYMLYCLNIQKCCPNFFLQIDYFTILFITLLLKQSACNTDRMCIIIFSV